MTLLKFFYKIKLNYNYLSSHLSEHTKTEIICYRIGLIGLMFYLCSEMYQFPVPSILMHFWGLSLFFYGYAAIVSSYRNFKECYILLIKNTFPVQGKIYIYGSLFFKMAPKGIKYVGGTIGMIGGVNYICDEAFNLRPIREISKLLGYYQEYNENNIEHLRDEIFKRDQEILRRDQEILRRDQEILRRDLELEQLRKTVDQIIKKK